MTHKERIIAALEHREADYVPYEMGFTEAAAAIFSAHFGESPYQSERCNRHFESTGAGHMEEIKPGYVRDEFGVIWNRTRDKDIGVVDNCLIPDYDGRTYVLPDEDMDVLGKRLDRMAAAKGDRFGLFNLGFSLFERAWTIRGMEHILSDMVLEPDNLAGLLGEITDRNLKILDKALACDAVDGVIFGDDWGSQRGLIMGREHWVKFIKPCLKKMYGRVKATGRFVMQHSCGDIGTVFTDLADIGLDCYQTFQPEIYDIEKVKREIGGRLAFWGGISTQQLLPRADAETVRSETARIMRIMGKNGGFIAAPTHAMPGDIPLENMLAMLDVFENQKKYGVIQ